MNIFSYQFVEHKYKIIYYSAKLFLLILFLILSTKSYANTDVDYMGCSQIIEKAVNIYKKRVDDILVGLKAGRITVAYLVREALNTGNSPEFSKLNQNFEKLGCSIKQLNNRLSQSYNETIDNLRFNQNDLNNIRLK